MDHPPYSAQNTKPMRPRERRVWGVARAALDALTLHFGAPANIAARNFLPRAYYKVLLSWICGLEALVRRLLLILASQDCAPLDPPPERETLQREFTFVRPQSFGRGGFAQPDAAKWPVRFVAAPPVRKTLTPRRARSSVSGQSRAPDFPSAWALAERLETLRRVIGDPKSYARKLRQTLFARARISVAAVKIACARVIRYSTRICPHLAAEVRGLDMPAQDAGFVFRLSG